MTDPRLAAAQRALDAGDAAAAARAAASVADDARMAAPVRSLALRMRAEACALSGDAAGALADARRASELAPSDPRAWNSLGIAAADAGEPELAIEAFGRATRLDPSYARAWNNLGNALRAGGRRTEALAAFGRAVAADPRYAFGWTNLAVARRDEGDDAGADEAAKRALDLDARQRTARIVIAGVARRAGDLDRAIDAYRRALADRPDDAATRLALAGTLAERDDMEAARIAYARAAEDDPGILRARLGAELALPMIVASEDAISRARAAFRAGVSRLRDELPRRAAAMPAARVLDELRWTNFLLAYHGEDDLALQSAYGDLVAATLDAARVPGQLAPAARRPGGRRRVAFVSAFLRDGTAGRYFESWITGLDRDRFEVVVHHLAHGGDALTARLRVRADRFLSHGGARTLEIAQAIAAGSPDTIVFPELGMDATTFALASLRLAPVQCAGWGHPVTSGLPTMDVMFASGPMEPDGADAHYRERLVRLPGLGTRYARPALPGRVPRAALSLPESVPLLLCPQSLFKLHPADDRRIARVLAASPGARVVAFAGRHPRLTAEWRARLDPVLDLHGVARDRVIVRPQSGHDDYLRVNLACDAMLDSVRWSGGNTTLDAIACGLPVATRPGPLMRARQSAAMLGLAGMPELIAPDEDGCIAIAARLAADRDWREALSRRVVEGAARVFDDAAPVDAFAAALESLTT
jgi:CRISPR-associated protein Csy1